MKDLTQDEINALVESNPQMTDAFYRMLTHYMMGYLRMAAHHDSAELTRQTFFDSIKRHVEANRK